MSRRSRIAGYGSAAALIVAGILGAVLISGGTGQLLALVLISLGFVLATSLVFLEVGLSEDRELERERKQRKQRERRFEPSERSERSGPTRLARMRGSRRRFR